MFIALAGSLEISYVVLTTRVLFNCVLYTSSPSFSETLIGGGLVSPKAGLYKHDMNPKP